MKKFAITLMVSAFAVTSLNGKATWEKSGNDYEKFSAAAKQDLLWKEITANQETYGWYNAINLGRIFTESMMPSLHWVGDTFENGWTGVRNKYIHSVGSVATIKYVPTENSEGYTGIFATGADHGLIRLSAAKQPDESKSAHSAEKAFDNFVPGFGLKFFRDGVASGNLVAMFGVNGADSWNFFKKDFSNHIGKPQSLALDLVAKKFATATPLIQYVGLSDIATFDQNGVKTDSPKFPFQLVFEPTLRDNYPDTYVESFQKTLAAIPEGTTLYKVYGYAEPDAPKVHIGDLTMTSKLVSSYFGDKYLFFKHQDMQEDVKIKPEWKNHLQVSAKGCPVAYAKSIFSFFYETVLNTVFNGVF